MSIDFSTRLGKAARCKYDDTVKRLKIIFLIFSWQDNTMSL
jgi:hypothetical protein